MTHSPTDLPLVDPEHAATRLRLRTREYHNRAGRYAKPTTIDEYLALMSTPGFSPVKVHKDELEVYGTSKDTIRFPADRLLPATLVRKLVKTRIAEHANAESRRR